VDEGLGALDVIVEVITEGLDQADGLLTVFLAGVAREQHKGDEGDVRASLKALDTVELDRGVTGVEQNLGRVLESGLTPGINEFLIIEKIKMKMLKGGGKRTGKKRKKERQNHT